MDIEAHPEVQMGLPALRKQLIARGYQEAITYSFIEPKLSALFDPDVAPVMLRNPISADMAAMRTSLLPGLVSVLRHNLNRQQTRARLFETGLRFVPNADGLKQEAMLAGLIYGSRAPESWANLAESVDFYDLKGDLEAVLALGGDAANYYFKAAKHSAMHPGQTAAIYRGDDLVGYIGALHPTLQQQLDIPQAVYLFELAQAPLLQARIPAFSSLSKFPEVRRDLAILVDRSLAADELLQAVKKQAGEFVKDLKVFDVYMGKGIDPQRKSVAMGLTFQHPSRTLNEDEINASIDTIVRYLEVNFSATLR
jgi:phenylalanyl-tRNA synthetase beta chain